MKTFFVYLGYFLSCILLGLYNSEFLKKRLHPFIIRAIPFVFLFFGILIYTYRQTWEASLPTWLLIIFIITPLIVAIRWLVEQYRLMR